MIVLFSTAVLTNLRAERISDRVPLPLGGESEGADTSRVRDLDEIVIVAQPKESGLLRTQPLSSSMFDANHLQSLKLGDVRQISLFVPTFTMPEYGSRYTSSAYIRGIGAKEGSSAIGMYVDGIPLATKSMYNQHVYGLERVDVLRGPQGTLYGMNSEGGLVRMYSRNPMNYEGTDLRVGGGAYGLRSAEAAHYHRFSDHVALSVASFYEGQSGFFRNQATGRRADLSNEAGGKLRLVYRPSRTLSFDYTADYQWVRQKGFPYGQLNQTSGHTARPATDYEGRYRRNLLTTGLSVQWQAPKFTLTSATSFQYLRDHMQMDVDYTPADLMRMNQHQRQRALTEELTLKSRENRRWQWVTGAFASAQWNKTNAPVFFRPGMNDHLSQTIQDFAYNGMFNAMSNRRMMELMAEGMSREDALRQADAETAADIEARGGVHIRMDIDAPIFGHFSTPQQNLGLFHESLYHITDHLTATLALRYDLSHTAIDYHTGAEAHIVESVLGTNVDARITDMLQHREDRFFHQLLPKAALRYSLPHKEGWSGSLYLSFSKGYRAGGYNMQSFGDILQPELRRYAQQARADLVVTHDEAAYAQIREAISYKPETSWNYELGTHLNLFDHKMQLDAALYYMELHNQQVSKFANNYGYGRLTVNAAKSYSCGFEVSLHGRATDNCLLYSLSYGYTHAAFKRFEDTIDGQTVSYKGNYSPLIPAHTLSARLDYRIPFSVKVLQSLTLGVNMTAQGKTYWDEANTYAQKFYATMGAHACLEFNKGVSLSLWGRNLTQTRYNTFAFDSSATGTSLFFAQRGAPLQVGADLSVHF
ncbi:MAG: TonB-dependent receptor [Bacteroidaceae bacterium]|nr:TonB-dependent receptor [Bacteroidaceae bacterium]